jgi:hypothetical protein
MICDLLARAGISARVDGEFLAGAGGELPLGSSIRVRVDPARAAEARQVIDEWERIQPVDPTPPVRRPLSRAPLWFLLGALCGGGFVYLGFNTPVTDHGVDLNDDGHDDKTYHHAGRKLTRVDEDRNLDGKIDERVDYDTHGIAQRIDSDDDFDGRFEWRNDLARTQLHTGTLDANGDGEPDEIRHSENGVLKTIDIYDDAGRRVVARQHFAAGFLVSADFDRDGDGQFENHVEYDRYGEPK